jgi:hypothetical protein
MYPQRERQAAHLSHRTEGKAEDTPGISGIYESVEQDDADMKKLHIIRVEKSQAGLIGVLLITSVVECFTLQPDPLDVHFSIPAGYYQCKRFHGSKWKDTFEILVSGHTSLLFHSGNVEANTEGCVLLGEEVGYLNGQRAVLASGKAFEGFMTKMGTDQECSLLIEDKY